MDPIHKELASGRWYSMTAMEQLGNIGSEVERALRWQQKDSVENRDKALYRALDLIDMTVRDPKWTRRLRELLRIREVLCDYFLAENSYSTSAASLSKEFLYYGIAARAGR